MTADLEFEGRDIEKAAEAASERLGIALEKLQYDVISYGSSGIFGLVGARKAKIRVLNKGLSKKRGSKADSDNGSPMLKAVAAAETAAAKSDPPIRVSEEVIQIGQELRRDLVHYENTEVVASTEGDRLLFEISGGNSAVLIGKRGQTLEALQYVVEKMVNAKCEARIRVQIDVEGYLRNRAENLEKMAARLAEKVLKNRKPATLGQLNSHDRRVVHLALKEEPGVRTQSLGNGYYRKLVIYPQKGDPQEEPGDQLV
ncbi:MAG: RNA-binding cell elongation regulator Jag/EloR [Desulfobacterales bacterium]|nr:RNA-binding cell elongation regulator Jag/EloR [Desulfobacterales bacterium]